ncbi:hypothetical protein [Nitrospira sp. BLG_2]|uniref:hypothetical protein n=1 Tax=Nitrospira sp. BLG_2 TaxID=3397507 RepID=UPI003B9C2253
MRGHAAVMSDESFCYAAGVLNNASCKHRHGGMAAKRPRQLTLRHLLKSAHDPDRFSIETVIRKRAAEKSSAGLPVAARPLGFGFAVGMARRSPDDQPFEQEREGGQ